MAQWRPVSRFSSFEAILSSSTSAASASSAAADPYGFGPRLHEALRGRPALVEMPFGSVCSLDASSVGGALRDSLIDSNATLETRSPSAVARSGGSFHATQGAQAADWLAGKGHPLIFDTRHGSSANRGVWEKLGAKIPQELKSFSRSPITSIGRAPEGGTTSDSQAAEVGGLAFHLHERNWLFLAAGRKRWFFHVCQSGRPPATALKRVSEATLRANEIIQADACQEGTELLTVDQKPGELMILPDGLWHCTYNLPPDVEKSDLILGVGGMGACHSEAHFCASTGRLDALEELGVAKEAAPLLARSACEQGQPDVLRWLLESFGIEVVMRPDEDAGSSTALHAAAGGGSVACLRLLLEAGAEASVLDGHKTQAAHWVARSGDPELLSTLAEFGANLEAEDGHCRCRPLHLIAGEGHFEAVKYLVEKKQVDASAADDYGMLAAQWALRNDHNEVANWLAARSA